MRIVTLSLTLLSMSLCVNAQSMEDDPLGSVGKPAEWISLTNEAPTSRVKPPDPPKVYGELLETPNQQRKRLGLAPDPSPAEPEYGVLEQTPNQKRRVAIATQQP